MKIFKTHRKLAVSSLALVVAVMAGGAAFAYFDTTGTGTGDAYVGSGSTVQITQLNSQTQTAYDSVLTPPTPDYWGLAFDATSTTDLGNKVNLASSTTSLENVVVELDSQACETGSGTTCTTTPGATFTSSPITVTIYSTGGVILASDSQTFNIPYRPSAAAVAYPSECTVGTTGLGMKTLVASGMTPPRTTVTTGFSTPQRLTASRLLVRASFRARSFTVFRMTGPPLLA
jgi:hypothetical protein